MITAIRIEYIDGNGLWYATNSDRKPLIETLSCEITIEDRWKNLHSPDEDGLKIKYNYFCAFKSIPQLQEWVLEDEIKEIIRVGFKIYMIDITEYQIGEHQIIYTKDSILQKKDITSLFN